MNSTPEDARPPSNSQRSRHVLEELEDNVYGEFSNSVTPRARLKRKLIVKRPSPQNNNRFEGFTKVRPSVFEIVQEFKDGLLAKQEAAERISVLRCVIDLKALKSEHVDNLKKKHRRGVFHLDNSAVLLSPAENDRYNILDGRHRIAALKGLFIEKYGSITMEEMLRQNILEPTIKAVILENDVPEDMQRLYGRIYHDNDGPKSSRVQHSCEKQITDLMVMRDLLLPHLPRTKTIGRSSAFVIKHQLTTVIDVEAEYVWGACVMDSAKDIVLQLAEAIDKGRITNGHGKTSGLGSFWIQFFKMFKWDMNECRSRFAQLMNVCNNERTMTCRNFLREMNLVSGPLNLFLNKYYESLPHHCWLFNQNAFCDSDIKNFILLRTKESNLDKMLARGEKPSNLRMMQSACLTLIDGTNAFPLFTTLEDLTAPEWDKQVISPDCHVVFIDMDGFSDCADVVTKEVKKMESTLCSVTMTIQKEVLHTDDYPQWEPLVKFLEEEGYQNSDRTWLTPHTDLEVDCQTRESRFLHYTKRQGLKFKGWENKCVLLRELPRLIPSTMSACYFVGNRDCRSIRPGVVPRQKNNAIIYRTRNDANAAHEEVGPTQYAFYRNPGYYGADGEIMTQSSSSTPSSSH